ncbi:uncharacterized protein I303_104802 [Kwoniella dejecticola CBS 10117]|uniref:Uncharacterized protein n=1 Tax=Kwoniella dejecticola CBS 10117 TaxID=1296121 RepID=A0A1A6A4A3_9TREE|nr:uncharacterized protein I303_04217 [Kwoniella dejecticola CBS 10117]OBR84895.1 hypothetical protein I303_04217 [Kwoniella dejecticola CBS 10117]
MSATTNTAVSAETIDQQLTTLGEQIAQRAEYENTQREPGIFERIRGGDVTRLDDPGHRRAIENDLWHKASLGPFLAMTGISASPASHGTCRTVNSVDVHWPKVQKTLYKNSNMNEAEQIQDFVTNLTGHMNPLERKLILTYNSFQGSEALLPGDTFSDRVTSHIVNRAGQNTKESYAAKRSAWDRKIGSRDIHSLEELFVQKLTRGSRQEFVPDEKRHKRMDFGDLNNKFDFSIDSAFIDKHIGEVESAVATEREKSEQRRISGVSKASLAKWNEVNQIRQARLDEFKSSRLSNLEQWSASQSGDLSTADITPALMGTPTEPGNYIDTDNAPTIMLWRDADPNTTVLEIGFPSVEQLESELSQTSK